MKNALSVVTIGDVRYVPLPALLEACTDPQVVAYAVALMKVGVEKGDPLSTVISHMLGGYALHVSGVQPQVPFDASTLAKMAPTLHCPVKRLAAELTAQAHAGKN